MAIDLFTIGKFTVHGYGLMIAVGFLAALIYASWQSKELNLDDDHIFNMAMAVLLFGWAGGKVLFCIVEIEQFLKDPGSVLGSEGFVVYGGIISAVVTMIIYSKIKKIDTLLYIEVISAAAALNQCFGRIGCFLAGCCYGRETDSFLGVVFPAGCLAPAGIKLLPTQIFSAAFDLLLFAVLAFIINRKHRKGFVMATYLTGYAVGRFIIEIFRNDRRGAVGFLSTSQFISIFILIAGVLVFYLCKNQEYISVEELKKQEPEQKEL